MTHKIKDLVDVVPAGGRPDAHRRPESEALATFLMSYELGDAVARSIERVTGHEEGPHNCLVVGGPGCGKSRLLEAVGALLEARSADGLHPRLAEIHALRDARSVLVVRIPQPFGERRLSAAIERTALDRLQAAGYPCPPFDADAGARLDAIATSAAALPHGDRLVLILDNLDRWLDAATRYAVENAHTLVRLGELSRTLPVSVCAAAGEYVITHDSTAGSQKWIPALLDSYRIEYVPARALRSATASNVLVKNARQRKDIAAVLGLLRSKLPELDCAEEEFVELYPLGTSTWTVGGHLHRWIEGFSFPEFAVRAAESVKRRPSPSLFALNDMFTLFEPQLRHVEALEPSFAAYDRLVADSLPKLGSQQRLWARLALQSIFMHTLSGISADVTTIVNSVLLYDLHGSGSSYAMMSAVLKQLETLDRGQLVATGEGSARRYSLVTGEREALLHMVDETAERIDDEEGVTWALLGAGGEVFADWPFAAPGPDRERRDLWEIDQDYGRIALTARSIEGRDTGDLVDRPRLVILAPGRTWSEASDEVRGHRNTACWIGAMLTVPERLAARRWVAASRLAASDRGRRFADFPSVLSELRSGTVDAFRRAYVDGGTLVTSKSSVGVVDLVNASRDENLVVRLMPTRDGATVARASDGLEHEGVWVARLLAKPGEQPETLAERLDVEGWTAPLEAWYGARVTRDDAGALRLLGERGATVPEIASALDARQLFDVALYYVRRALASGSAHGLGESIAKIFETPERLEEARARLDWLAGFSSWLPELERARSYVANVEPVDDAELAELRETLVEWAGRLDDFVDDRRREAFSSTFDAYREEYAREYVVLHDATVGAETVDALAAEIVGSRSWKSLEALSSLTIGDQTYLVDAINLISAIRDAQCPSDVEAALRERPVCTCRFRFAERERVATIAASARELVAEGIAHHRHVLETRRDELRVRVMAAKSSFDLATIRAIAELTKDGPLPDVDVQTVAAINELLGGESGWAHGDPAEPLTFRTKSL